MDDCIHRLSSTKDFSLLNALLGYWYIPIVDEESGKKALASHMGIKRYLQMPFGLHNALTTFQRARDLKLSGVRWRSFLVYLEDVIIFSKFHDEYFDQLHQIICHLKEAGMKLRMENCFSL